MSVVSTGGKGTENRNGASSQKNNRSESKGTINSQSSFSTKKPLPPTRSRSGDSRNTVNNNNNTNNNNNNTNNNNGVSTNVIPETPIDAISLKHDLHIDNTKYVFHLSKLSCHIEDHENNVFDLDYFNPHEPRVLLAGEVEGLKPKAITEKTVEAKVYIINRNGNAVQVIGSQEMGDLELFMKMASDSMKYVTEAKFPPCDLGGAKLHTYFKKRYLFLLLLELLFLFYLSNILFYLSFYI